MSTLANDNALVLMGESVSEVFRRVVVGSQRPRLAIDEVASRIVQRGVWALSDAGGRGPGR